jgi:hypothetical protein
MADRVLKSAASLKRRIVERTGRDAETLGEAVAKHERRIAALQERERQLEHKINH